METTILRRTVTPPPTQHRHPILIIEDDPDIREALAGFLEAEGYSTLAVENGQRGLELLVGRYRPCIILLDLYMPVLDGAGFLSALQCQGLRDGLSIVVLSAAPPGSQLVRKVLPQVSAFLEKPVDLDAVLDQVRRRCTRL